MPPLGIERAVASAGHFRSQVLPPAQLTWQLPVQVTWQVAPVHPRLPEPIVALQVAPDVQLRLALVPVVKLHVDPELQLRLALLPALIVQVLPPLQGPLQEFPQLPPQLPLVQESEQLAAAGSQPIWLKELPPHAASAATANAAKIIFTVHPFGRFPHCDPRSSGPATTRPGR